MNPQHSEPIQDILSAIVYLSDCCDGASSEDGQGFNKYDADNGHRMADIIRNGGSLSMLDFHRAQGMVRKYHKQLNKQQSQPIVSTPSNGLNEQQQSAFDGVLNWFGDRYGERHAQIKGYAGTGKTFTVQRIAKSITGKVCFTSPTHKANQVLSTMAHDAGLTVDVCTIHSLLGLSLQYDKHGKQKIVQKADDKSYKYDLVVIDEASMIGADLWQYVEQGQSRFLLMGDPCQLPPIDEVESSVFSAIADSWELTKVVRYDGAIFKYVTDIRENIDAKSLPFKKFERGVFEKYDRDKWMIALINRYQKMLQSDDQNSNSLRALAWTNRRVQDINIAVRNALYGADALPYIIGERLVAKDLIEVPVDGYVYGDWQNNAKWATGSSTTLMHSCDECVITNVTRGTKKVFGVDFNGYFLVVTTDLGDDATIFTVNESEKDKVTQVCNGQKKAILDTHIEYGSRSQMWAIYYKGLNELNLKSVGNGYMRKLQYAFALTIHQSQGSTFGCVFADTFNVFGCQDVKLRNQLLYVQGSRASQELYIA